MGKTRGLIWIVLPDVFFTCPGNCIFAKQLKNKSSSLKKISMLIPIVVIMTLLLNHFILEMVENEPFMTKMIITFLFIFPQFFLMGMVFPSLLSMVQKESIPKMIALNSAATVIGSVMALMIAMTTGFIQVALAGGLLYLPLTRKDR